MLPEVISRNWVQKRENFWKEAGRQQRLFDIGWSDESKCQACHKEEGTEKHRLYHSPEWYEIRREIPEAFRKWEQKARTLKERVEVAKRYRRASSVKAKGMEGPLSMMKAGVGEAYESWGMCQQEVSRVALPRMALFWVQLESGEHVAGQWCNWIMPCRIGAFAWDVRLMEAEFGG